MLAITHTCLAYPYYRSWRGLAYQETEVLALWLVAWLGTLREETSDLEEAAGAANDEEVDDGVSGETLEVNGETPDSPEKSPEQSEKASDAGEGDGDGEAGADDFQVISEKPTCGVLSPWCCRLLNVLTGVCCCYLSIWFILRLLPLEVSTYYPVPLRNITCSGEGDLAHFLEARSQLHFTVQDDTFEKWSVPDVAGSWLPLCASTYVGCATGYYAVKTLPSLSCTAMGHYAWEGQCHAISCGLPLRLPHATPRLLDMERQNWTYGVMVHYDCERPGFHGSLESMCNITGEWVVQGECVEVNCGPPPKDIPHAKSIVGSNGEGENVSTGIVVRYQCDWLFDGTPTATCGDDGMYIVEGRCRKECGPPPVLPRASPSFDNALISDGWTEGMRVSFVCDPGYEGFVTALCGTDGNYTSSGFCSIASSVERELLIDKAQALEATVKSLQASIGARDAAIGMESSVLLGGVMLWSIRKLWLRTQSQQLSPHSQSRSLKLPQQPPLSTYSTSDKAPVVHGHVVDAEMVGASAFA